MKDVEEDGYKYLGVLQAEVQMNREMKEKSGEGISSSCQATR